MGWSVLQTPAGSSWPVGQGSVPYFPLSVPWVLEGQSCSSLLLVSQLPALAPHLYFFPRLACDRSVQFPGTHPNVQPLIHLLIANTTKKVIVLEFNFWQRIYTNFDFFPRNQKYILINEISGLLLYYALIIPSYEMATTECFFYS